MILEWLMWNPTVVSREGTGDVEKCDLMWSPKVVSLEGTSHFEQV